MWSVFHVSKRLPFYGSHTKITGFIWSCFIFAQAAHVGTIFVTIFHNFYICWMNHISIRTIMLHSPVLWKTYWISVSCVNCRTVNEKSCNQMQSCMVYSWQWIQRSGFVYCISKKHFNLVQFILSKAAFCQLMVVNYCRKCFVVAHIKHR